MFNHPLTLLNIKCPAHLHACSTYSAWSHLCSGSSWVKLHVQGMWCDVTCGTKTDATGAEKMAIQYVSEMSVKHIAGWKSQNKWKHLYEWELWGGSDC